MVVVGFRFSVYRCKMKTVLPSHVVALKRQYRRALRDLRKAATDFSPDSDRRFRELKDKAECLYEKLYFAEVKHS